MWERGNFLNSIKRKLEFPNGGFSPNSVRVFRGSNKFLQGFSERTRRDVFLGSSDEKFHVRAKTRYLEVHFEVDAVSIKNGEVGKVITTMAKGTEDLLDLTTAFGQKNGLAEMKLIVGTTNPTMARLAVNRYGFRYGNPEVFKSRKKQKRMRKGLGTPTTIYITRDELLSQREKIEEIRTRLKSIQDRRNEIEA